MKGRWPLVAGGLVLVSLFIWGLITVQRQNQYNESAPKEPETTTNQKPTVVITGTGELANILLSSQFFAVRDNLVAHLLKAYPKAKSAEISNTKVNSDGSISFDIKISSYGKTLQGTVLRQKQGSVVVQIPSENYNSGVLGVYDNNNGD